MNAALPNPKPSLVDHASNAANLAKGTLPLFKSGVLGGMTPTAAGKAIKGIFQWRFLPAGLLAIGAGRDPFHTAIIDDAGSMTYQELHEQSNSLARALFRTGVRERDRIGVLCRNHRGLVLALCAHGRLGTDIVFFNTGASAEQTRAVLEEQKIDVLFIDEEFLPLLPKNFNACPVVLAWENGDTLGLSADAEAELPQPSNVRGAIDSGDYATRNPDWSTMHEIITSTPDHLSIPSRPRMGRTIILTSGTTGTPKGARRPEPKTYMPASSIMSRIPLKHHRPVFLAAPMFHTWGFAQIQLALALRNTMILQRRFSPKAAVKLIEKNKPYTIAMVPTMLRKLLEAVPEDFNPGTKIIATSGEALPPKVILETQEKFGDVLYNLYGSTEVSWASIATPEELREHPRTAGKPPMATTLKIIDEDGNELPEGEVGRVFVKNDMLFEGYTRPGVDKEVIDGMVATGDLGYYEDGLLYISGRSDDMIVSGGENVFPQETEDVINSMDAVAEAAVRGVDDPDFGQALCAWIVPASPMDEEQQEKFQEEAKTAVKQKLARHSVPRYFVFLDKLPRNEVGKVVPRELPQP
ncbi:MAG TPA: AMP-binding protein [Candidatus Corynebacterium gallistercoris]|uniref:AMP-binding protein n=1 Tax=Candidatus Corynebacterium gallistercoris TaxID=2838530 RepID=A0A9D1RYA1_9CORY|nr:AMP-binding protein [Candidatus Corynebacterium gallistercoris]